MGLAESGTKGALQTKTQLALFQGGVGPQLEACAALSERVAQLAFSHPLLFFGLATGWGPLAQRCAAIELAVEGRPLADVCDAMGLPFLLRRLPAESCREALPWVQWSADSGRQLAPHMPEVPDQAASWLRAISLSHYWCDEAFAIWTAAQPALFRGKPALGRRALFPLALFAWFSQRPELAASPPRAWRWSPTLGFETTLQRLAAWLELLQLISDIGLEGLSDSWLPPASVEPYHFEPLTTPVALVAEGSGMKNCVVRYGARMARGSCRLFSLRRHGERIATIEVGYSRATGKLEIAQIKGYGNRSCTRATIEMAHRWLAEQDAPSQLPRAVERGAGKIDALLAAYRVDTGPGSQWTPSLSLSSLVAGLQELEQCVGVRVIR